MLLQIGEAEGSNTGDGNAGRGVSGGNSIGHVDWRRELQYDIRLDSPNHSNQNLGNLLLLDARSTDGVVITPVENAEDFADVDSRFPSGFLSWSTDADAKQTIELGPDATHFGFVHSGSIDIEGSSGSFSLKSGMYFSLPGAVQLTVCGAGFIASRIEFLGFFQIGGPIEERGRLEYIDGCSDSLLISPVTLGDPCLNFLYLPPGTEQTQHTHPSCRLGMIVGGSGECRTAERVLPLRPGLAFQIAPDAIHSFHTRSDALQVIAWHPDSDCGPSNYDHPMINRTIIDGVSAARRKQHQQMS